MSSGDTPGDLPEDRQPLLPQASRSVRRPSKTSVIRYAIMGIVIVSGLGVIAAMLGWISLGLSIVSSIAFIISFILFLRASNRKTIQLWSGSVAALLLLLIVVWLLAGWTTGMLYIAIAIFGFAALMFSISYFFETTRHIFVLAQILMLPILFVTRLFEVLALQALNIIIILAIALAWFAIFDAGGSTVAKVTPVLTFGIDVTLMLVDLILDIILWALPSLIKWYNAWISFFWKYYSRVLLWEINAAIAVLNFMSVETLREVLLWITTAAANIYAFFVDLGLTIGTTFWDGIVENWNMIKSAIKFISSILTKYGGGGGIERIYRKIANIVTRSWKYIENFAYTVADGFGGFITAIENSDILEQLAIALGKARKGITFIVAKSWNVVLQIAAGFGTVITKLTKFTAMIFQNIETIGRTTVMTVEFLFTNLVGSIERIISILKNSIAYITDSVRCKMYEVGWTGIRGIPLPSILTGSAQSCDNLATSFLKLQLAFEELTSLEFTFSSVSSDQRVSSEFITKLSEPTVPNLDFCSPGDMYDPDLCDLMRGGLVYKPDTSTLLNLMDSRDNTMIDLCHDVFMAVFGDSQMTSGAMLEGLTYDKIALIEGNSAAKTHFSTCVTLRSVGIYRRDMDIERDGQRADALIQLMIDANRTRSAVIERRERFANVSDIIIGFVSGMEKNWTSVAENTSDSSRSANGFELASTAIFAVRHLMPMALHAYGSAEKPSGFLLDDSVLYLKGVRYTPDNFTTNGKIENGGCVRVYVAGKSVCVPRHRTMSVFEHEIADEAAGKIAADFNMKSGIRSSIIELKEAYHSVKGELTGSLSDVVNVVLDEPHREIAREHWDGFTRTISQLWRDEEIVAAGKDMGAVVSQLFSVAETMTLGTVRMLKDPTRASYANHRPREEARDSVLNFMQPIIDDVCAKVSMAECIREELSWRTAGHYSLNYIQNVENARSGSRFEREMYREIARRDYSHSPAMYSNLIEEFDFPSELVIDCTPPVTSWDRFPCIPEVDQGWGGSFEIRDYVDPSSWLESGFTSQCERFGVDTDLDTLLRPADILNITIESTAYWFRRAICGTMFVVEYLTPLDPSVYSWMTYQGGSCRHQDYELVCTFRRLPFVIVFVGLPIWVFWAVATTMAPAIGTAVTGGLSAETHSKLMEAERSTVPETAPDLVESMIMSTVGLYEQAFNSPMPFFGGLYSPSNHDVSKIHVGSALCLHCD